MQSKIVDAIKIQILVDNQIKDFELPIIEYENNELKYACGDIFEYIRTLKLIKEDKLVWNGKKYVLSGSNEYDHWKGSLYTTLPIISIIKDKQDNEVHVFIGMESIENNYGEFSKKVQQLIVIKKIIDNLGIVLGDNSKVLDIGSNISAITSILRRKYNFNRTLLDTSYEALLISLNKNFENTSICSLDLLKDNVLKFYPDNYFDLGISMGFLMHLRPSEEKTEIVRNLLRTSKNVLLVEVFDPNKQGQIIESENGWVCSYEDYLCYDDELNKLHVQELSDSVIYYKLG